MRKLLFTLFLLILVPIAAKSQPISAHGLIDHFVFPTDKMYSLIADKYYFVYANENMETISVVVAHDSAEVIVDQIVIHYPCTVEAIYYFDFKILGFYPLNMEFDFDYLNDNNENKQEKFIYTGYGWRKEEGVGQIPVECK